MAIGASRRTVRPGRPDRRLIPRRLDRHEHRAIASSSLRPPSRVSEYQVPNALAWPIAPRTRRWWCPRSGRPLMRTSIIPAMAARTRVTGARHRRHEGRIAPGVDEHLPRPSRTRRRCRRGRPAAALRGRRFLPTEPRPGGGWRQAQCAEQAPNSAASLGEMAIDRRPLDAGLLGHGAHRRPRRSDRPCSLIAASVIRRRVSASDTARRRFV